MEYSIEYPICMIFQNDFVIESAIVFKGFIII